MIRGSLHFFFIAAAMTVCVAAQDSEKPSAFSVEQTIAEAKAELDRVEARPERPVPREYLAGINEKIVAIETHDPGNVWLSYLYGRAFFLMGQTSEAAGKLRAFIETREGRNEWRAYRTLGDLFVGEFPNLAESYYKKAAALNSTESSIYYGLSLCAFRRGAAGDAVRLARQAVQLGGGKNVAHLSHLARVLAADQQWREADRTALSAVERAKALAKEHAGVRASLEQVVSQYDQLIALVQKEFAATGTDGGGYLRLAGYVTQRADIARRVAKFDTLGVLESGVNATKPSTPIALLEQYAVTLAEVGRRDEAIAAFENLLTRDASNATAKEWLIRLNAPVASKSSQ